MNPFVCSEIGIRQTIFLNLKKTIRWRSIKKVTYYMEGKLGGGFVRVSAGNFNFLMFKPQRFLNTDLLKFLKLIRKKAPQAKFDDRMTAYEKLLIKKQGRK